MPKQIIPFSIYKCQTRKSFAILLLENAKFKEPFSFLKRVLKNTNWKM